MELQAKINEAIKTAMKQHDQAGLRALRAIKSALLLAQTEKAGAVIDEAREIQVLQKLAKQRKDSMQIFKEQGRNDLYDKEAEELAVIETYLPAPMDAGAVQAAIAAMIAQTGARGMADLSKVMPVAMKALAGKVDNKTISETIKQLLSA
jgi:uncharacterized protein YqeY